MYRRDLKDELKYLTWMLIFEIKPAFSEIGMLPRLKISLTLFGRTIKFFSSIIPDRIPISIVSSVNP